MVADSNSAPTGGSADEEALCRDASAGSEKALARLLALHHERLFEHAVRKVGPDWRGKLDPEDLLQEAYEDIYSGIGTFKHQGLDSFYHWAAHILDRRYVDQVRRQRARKRDVSRETALAARGSSSSTYHGLLDQCLRDTGTPSRFASAAEEVSGLMSGLARLPEDYRNVLRRLYLNDEPLGAIAADMRRTEDAVRRLASRALDRLRRVLEGDLS